MHSGSSNRISRILFGLPSVSRHSLRQLRVFAFVRIRGFVFLILSKDNLSETFSVDVWRASEVLISDVASVEVSKGRRKRNSSEISPEEDDRLFDEAKLKKMKTLREKDCVNVVFETNKENVRQLYCLLLSDVSPSGVPSLGC